MKNNTTKQDIPDIATAVKPAAIWARVSTNNQAETSLPSQVARCKERLEQLGYSVIHTFQTDWTSMDLFSCPQFQELRRLIKDREIDAITVFDRDRLEAKGLQRLLFLSECKEAGIELVICQGPPILDEPEGQLVELALALGKERQVMRARQGSRDGLHDRATRRGLPITYHRLYGYTWDKANNKLLPDENWPNLKLIFDMLLQGASFGLVIDELKNRGIPSPSGQPEWTKTALSSFVHNPAYTGKYYALKKRAVEPKQRKGNTYGNSSCVTVSLDEAHYIPDIEIVNHPITWEQQQRILNLLAQRQKLSQRNAKRDYLLRGFIYCSTHTGKKGEPRIYHGQPHMKKSYRYVCPVGGCQNAYLNGPRTDQEIKSLITDVLRAEPPKFYKSMVKNREKLREALKKELASYDTKYRRAIEFEAQAEDRFLSGIIDREIYEKLKVKYHVERKGAETRKMELLDTLAQLGREEDALKTISKLRNQFLKQLKNMTNSQWRQLFTQLNMVISSAPEEYPDFSKPYDLDKVGRTKFPDINEHNVSNLSSIIIGYPGGKPFKKGLPYSVQFLIPINTAPLKDIALVSPERG